MLINSGNGIIMLPMVLAIFTLHSIQGTASEVIGKFYFMSSTNIDQNSFFEPQS